LEELAEVKRPVMNTDNIDSIVKSLAGTAKSLGIEVTL
jgi:ribosomal protein L11